MGHADRIRHLHLVGPETTSDDAPLIERAVERLVLTRGVRRLAIDRAGGVVLLAAPAGLGKTALLEQVTPLAARTGCQVRRAAAGPLERHFQFGVIRALLEAPLRDASPRERARLLEGAAGPAGELLLEGRVPAGDTTTLIAHSILWLCAALADHRPLVLVVDDAQWADRASLEVLNYLARRIDDLPLLITVAARDDDPEAPSDLLSLLGGARSATVLHPRPLTPAGAMRLIRRVAPGTPDDVCHDCHQAVGGNPWLLGELARQIAAHGPAAIVETADGAPQVTAIARNVVRRRLAALSARDRAVAEALAVIGDGAPPHVVAAVAGVTAADLGPARDALLAAGLLGAEDGRFAHWLIAVAIAEDLSRAECERLHREAARALMHARADADLVASHLLRTAPQADPEVSGLLLGAASAATERGAPHAAAAYLERAVHERAPGDDRGRMLAQLAAVAFDAGLPDSRRRLLEALHEVRDRESRLDVLTRLAALSALGTGEDSVAHLFEAELATEADPDARLAIEAAALDTVVLAPGLLADRARRLDALRLTPTTDLVAASVITAYRAWVGLDAGGLDARACAALALEALDGGQLLGEIGRRTAYHLCVRTLVLTDHAEEARRAIAAMHEEALVRGSLRLRVATAWHACELALRTGEVAEAENHARLALDLVDEDVNIFTGGAITVLVSALAERGAFDEAHELLRERCFDGALGMTRWEIGLRHARAELWLAQGDFERAHAEALDAGALREAQGRPNPTWTPWRSTAALALAHLGRREEAAALADLELAMAEAFGAPVPIARAFHARAVAEPDEEERIALAERALRAAERAPAQREAIRARLELGRTLTYTGARIHAREVLRPALADADAAGAVLLAERARRELVASGLRPRHAALEGPAALTPRQRQVCELAAAGKGNRAIAQQLFLSIKTVETHLAAGYRKLGVNTRAELADRLAA